MKYIYFLLIIIVCFTSNPLVFAFYHTSLFEFNGHTNSTYHYYVKNVLHYIHGTQHPENMCRTHENGSIVSDRFNTKSSSNHPDYYILNITSQLLLHDHKDEKLNLELYLLRILNAWIHMFQSSNFSRPIIIRGSSDGLSNSKEYKSVNNDIWTCFFNPSILCQAHMLQTKHLTFQTIQLDSFDMSNITISMVPPQFHQITDDSVSFWRSTVALWLFQLNSNMKKHILREAFNLGNPPNAVNKGGFPFGIASIGIRYPNRKEEKESEDNCESHFISKPHIIHLAGWIREAKLQSPDCNIRNIHNDCFASLLPPTISNDSQLRYLPTYPNLLMLVTNKQSRPMQ
mmetsp:Transcript_33548/g.48671  ORF Transcript_33548/g.48671 Transcript_33548/m.48671 type:complete len:343 (-) Transcript_33548:590-1618(-)